MQTETGETALHTASRCGHVNVITVLVDRGADVNSLTKVGGVNSSIVEDGALSLELDEAYTACGGWSTRWAELPWVMHCYVVSPCSEGGWSIALLWTH